ncbi:MAG: prolipoprotein diacylglyceryl transferase [Bacteroidetes bacterium]|nr:prolipoprotein diacylglyceryl transferase [Bacteroidota bacterium]
MNLAFIIWNGSPEIFTAGQITLRWYGLLFALGFLISQQLLTYMYRKEGKPEKEVDNLTILMVVATILGARLGHVIFYQPDILWNNPLGVLLPFEFTPKFRFTGLQGLASHGGAIAILTGLYLYARKKKVSYLQVLDRIVILVCITGACIRLGNYFNSEIIGKPTEMPWGVVFTNKLTHALEYKTLDNNPVLSAAIIKDEGPRRDTVLLKRPGARPLLLYMFFKPDVTEEDMRFFVNSRAKNYVSTLSDFFYDDPTAPLDFSFVKQDNAYAVKARVVGIARHPAQLYESLSCLILFVALFMFWNKHRINLPDGRIFGFFMIALWGLRFAYEFLKENQEYFENDLPLNMGQLLSIPLFVSGIIILIRSYKKPEPAGQG